MIVGEGQTKDRFKRWQLWCVRMLLFWHRVIKLMQKCVCFTNPCINLPVYFPSLTNATPKYLNFSTCCSVLPLTCTKQYLRVLERHNTSVFSMLIFIPAWLHVWKPIKCMLKILFFARLTKYIETPLANFLSENFCMLYFVLIYFNVWTRHESP